MSKIIVPLAQGFEEIEAVSIIDVCRRAGIEVCVAGVETMLPEGANGITIHTDASIDELDEKDFDMIVLPGGFEGAEILSKNRVVQGLLKEFHEKNKYIGAICAAPIALQSAGVLGKNYTCYPSVKEHIKNDGHISKSKVVVDNNILTSRGPGTALCFGLEIVRTLVDETSYQSLKEGLLADFC